MDQITHWLEQLLTGSQGPGVFQLMVAMGIAYLGGVLSSFTPCVYPMIPITVGVIGGMARTDGSHFGTRPWKEILARSLSYMGGMVAVYSFLGVLAGLTGRIFGTLTNSSGWYLTLGIILSLAALAMAEAIPFDPAQWWASLARKWNHRKGAPVTPPVSRTTESLWGAAGLGAGSGIISSPCTTPVLTVILAFIAKSQSIGMGLALMIGFSLGLGTLLIVISLFTGALQILPRSGTWMKTVKVVSGLILLAFGEYLIYRAGVVSR